MTIRTPAQRAGLCLLLAVTTASTWASEPGNQMKMTTSVRMQMAGMPAMPPMTHTMDVCSSARLPDPQRLMQQRKDCTVSDVQRSGDSMSYHMACTGAMPMSGDGKFRMTASGDVHGSFHMVGSRQGRSIVMDSQIDGQRIGACDYTPPTMHN